MHYLDAGFVPSCSKATVMIEEGTVVALFVMTMVIVGLQDAHHIRGLESTPLDIPPLMVEDQGGITPGRLLTPRMAARIGGILMAPGEASFNVPFFRAVKDDCGWL